MGTEVILVGILSLFMLSHVMALLINIKVQHKRKNYTNNMPQRNRLTDELGATEVENDSEISVEKIVQDLESRDISFDFSNLIKGFTLTKPALNLLEGRHNENSKA